jgi:hypothetical protein
MAVKVGEEACGCARGEEEGDGRRGRGGVEERAQVGGEFDGGVEGGDGAVDVGGIGEVRWRDEEVEAGEAELVAAEGGGEVAAGGALELARAEAGRGGVELDGGAAEG